MKRYLLALICLNCLVSLVYAQEETRIEEKDTLSSLESEVRNRDYHVKAEDVKSLLSDWKGADGCIATNRITVEGCKVGYCYREKPDGDWVLL